MAEVETNPAGHSRDPKSSRISTAPNYFPPSARKPLPSIPRESRDANPSTPTRADKPATGVPASLSQPGPDSLESPNFSRPRPFESRLGALKSPTFSPSPYGTLPRPFRTLAEAEKSTYDPFLGGIDEEGEIFKGDVVINTKPVAKLLMETKSSRGSSFERIVNVTESLRRGQYDNGGTKLDRVERLVVRGLWNGVGFSKHDTDHGIDKASDTQRKEEGQAVELIAAVLGMMDHLQELEWRTELPFTKTLWPAMSTATITSVFIDLFRAGLGEYDGNGAFPPDDLVPLRALTALKSLTIVGMTESYQKQIWETLWLIPSIKHLDLRMVTEPALRRDRDEGWELIMGSWKIRRLDQVALTYHGDRGNGTVHFNSGYGEYLDVMCMMKAWRSTHPDEFQHKMGLESLTLEGFVVDAQPFMKIFDENQFKKLEFIGLNVDAGLGLKPEMIGIIVVVPGEEKQPQIRKMTRFPPTRGAKLVALGGCKRKPEKK